MMNFEPKTQKGLQNGQPFERTRKPFNGNAILFKGNKKGTKSGLKVVKIAFRAPQKSQKTCSLIGKTHTGKPNAQNLIKPVENEDFWSKNRKMASKMIKKHYVYR